MSNIFYNVASQDISDGLTDFEVSSGQDYFILLSAPTNANVTVKLNSNTAPAIPIHEFWQFKSADLNKLYISTDAINGASITYGQADGNVKITTNPQIASIDTITNINSFNNTLLTQLDKLINPFEIKQILRKGRASGNYSNLINISSCSFDEIEFILCTNDYISSISVINISIDGETIYRQACDYIDTNTNGDSSPKTIRFRDLKGRSLFLDVVGNTQVIATSFTKKD